MPVNLQMDVDAMLRVLNHLNMGVYITDLDRRIVLWNRRCEEIMGFRAEDVVGRACHEQILNHVTKDGQPLCSTKLCPLYRAMTLNEASAEPILLYAHKPDRSRVAVSVSVAPLRDETGEVVGGIEAFQDESSRVRDLEFAQNVQQHLLPKSLPKSEEIHFDVRYYPHDLVGGDFYDIRELSPGKFGVFLADVRGHGVSAALYTMVLKNIGDNLVHLAADPAAFVGALNRALSKVVVAESFATGFYAVVDAVENKITCTNAGHPGALHYHACDDSVTQLGPGGLPLGVLEDETYEAESLKLEPGDLLLSYTDGATEVVDKQGQMLGDQGLGALLSEAIARGKSRLLDRLYRSVLDTCASVSLTDDVLLLSIRRDG